MHGAGFTEDANEAIRLESQSTSVIRLAPCLPLVGFSRAFDCPDPLQADTVVFVARSKSAVSFCPCCSRQTRRVHSHYVRRLADLPWQGRVVEIQLHARRFRCANSQCSRRIFTERLPAAVRPKARRTSRLGESQLAIGFAVGGEAGARLSCKLAKPASGDTLLRMIRAAEFKSPEAPRVACIDDWAWRKRLRYGTIICDLSGC